MSTAHGESLDTRMRCALDELCGVILERFPEATFEIARDRDEPENVDLLTTVDLEDPDEVMEVVLDRLVQLQVEERIPVHVIPLRTPERIMADMRTHPRPSRRVLPTVSSRSHPLSTEST